MSDNKEYDWKCIPACIKLKFFWESRFSKSPPKSWIDSLTLNYRISVPAHLLDFQNFSRRHALISYGMLVKTGLLSSGYFWDFANVSQIHNKHMFKSHIFALFSWIKVSQNDHYVLDSRLGSILIPGGMLIIFANLSKRHVYSMGHAYSIVQTTCILNKCPHLQNSYLHRGVNFLLPL